MKRYPRAIPFLAALVLAAWLPACGQKGELYMESGEAAPAGQQVQAGEEDDEDNGD